MADLSQAFDPERSCPKVLHRWQHIEHLFTFPKVEDRAIEDDKEFVPEMPEVIVE